MARGAGGDGQGRQAGSRRFRQLAAVLAPAAALPAAVVLAPLVLALGGCGVQPGSEAAAGDSAPQKVAATPATALRGDDVLGWTPADLRGRFGPPGLTFTEPPAEVWRYSGAHCVALFFFYPQGEANVVRHLEVLPRLGTRPPAADCLRELGSSRTVATGAG